MPNGFQTFVETPHAHGIAVVIGGKKREEEGSRANNKSQLTFQLEER
jgi:hypothetical protein